MKIGERYRDILGEEYEIVEIDKEKNEVSCVLLTGDNYGVSVFRLEDVERDLKYKEEQMNNQIEIFKNEEFGQVRTMLINNEPYFVGKDVAEILGYANPQKAIRTHVDNEDKGVNEMDTPGGKQEIIVINESGLYSLILSSKLPTAKKFKRWVTSEVLPSIRKNGTYSIKEEKIAKLAEMETETKLNNSQTRKANSLMRMHKQCNDPIVKELLFKKAIETLTGKKLIDNTKKTYSAEEIGKKFGISANRVGRIANANNLKTEQYGEMVATEYNDKAQGSTFRYYDTVIPAIENIINKEFGQTQK